MKQLGLGFAQYATDFDENLPCGNNNSTFGIGHGWAGQLSSFVGSQDVYHCPDDTLPNTVKFDKTHPYTSYCLNEFLSGDWVNELNQYAYASSTSLPLAKLNAPASQILLYECLAANMDGGATFAEEVNSPLGDGYGDKNTTCPFPVPNPYDYNIYGKMVYGVMVPRHEQTSFGLNYLFADNHAKFLPRNSVSLGRTAIPTDQVGVKQSDGRTYAATLSFK